MGKSVAPKSFKVTNLVTILINLKEK